MRRPKITVAEIVAAAEVLEKMSAIYEYSHPELAEWSPDDLRRELPHIADLEKQQRIHADIARQVGDEVIGGLDVVEAVMVVLDSYEVELVEQ